ncbi:MAG: metallophosphoesterase [Rikenellaceae bacterium]|nr:metallophosphoesterase [Rikenellaceae bacterium]
MKFLPFIILALYLGANYYVLLRIWQMLPAGIFLRPLLLTAGIVLSVSFFAVLVFRHSVPIGIGSVLYTVGTAWLIILLYLFIVILIADLLPFTGLYRREVVMRSNMLTFGIVAGIVTLIMVAGNLNYHYKRRIEITVDASVHGTSSLPEPLKIVAVSDLHLGYSIGKRELGKWIGLINAENPDIVIIAGDLIDNDVRPLYKEDIGEVLREIRSKYGVFIVPGNHEYISGIDKSVEFLGSAGLTVLRDSVVTVAGAVIAGRDDLTNKHRKSLPQLLAETDRRLPVIVVDHQPSSLDDAVAAGALLQISGHTHRGQVWPFNWLTDAVYEDSYGLESKNGTQIYVSSGLGIWGGKFRIGTVSEYVVIEVR